MNRQIFSTITLLNGAKCCIYECRTGDLMRAGFQMAIYDREYKVGMVAYMLQQILTINDEMPSLEYIFNLSIDDYNSISDVVDVSFKKLKL